MRIIHCGDLHLDSKMESNLSKEKAKERRYEILDTFENMVAFAKEQAVSVILIAGDMFDTPQNMQKTIKNRVLETIRNSGEIDFLYLQGNHDKDDYFQTLEDRPTNLKLFGEQWTSYRYEDIVINGMQLGQNANKDFYASLNLEEDLFQIVTLHGQVIKHDSTQNSDQISLKRLQNKNIDYLALGHIHQYQKDKLDYRGTYCYCGCLEGRGFDECGKKGFVLLDIQNKTMESKFVSLGKRVCHEVEIDVSTCSDFDMVIKMVQIGLETISNSDLVKLVFVGETIEELQLDINYIETKWKNQFYLFKIKDKTTMKIDYNKYENDISLKGEFVRSLQNSDLEEEMKNQIISLGINALLGREISI